MCHIETQHNDVLHGIVNRDNAGVINLRNLTDMHKNISKNNFEW